MSTQVKNIRSHQIQALSDFLEFRANAKIGGHTSHDGPGCNGHQEAFHELAEDLLELIEDDFGYGETPEAQAALAAKVKLEKDTAFELWIQRNSDDQLWAAKTWAQMTSHADNWDPEALECLDEARRMIEKETN